MNDDGYRPIADYAFLSDCHSTALVSTECSIDWACLRRFDSGSVFGRLLDAEQGGFFSIRPVAPITDVERSYRPSTMILETTMTTQHGTVRVTDAFAMAVGGSGRLDGELLRHVECLDGRVEIEVVVEPRFDYGATRPWLRCHEEGRYTAVGGDDAVVVHVDGALDVDRERYRLCGRMTIAAGEAMACSVVSQAAHLVDPSSADRDSVLFRLEETEAWWTSWARQTDVSGPFAELLERSAIVLKGLTCAPTGAVVAAPTTSLPEIPGGCANWDYRYSWVRDATLTLGALAEVGHHEVAQGFRDFVMRSAAGQGDELQIMFGPYGERRLPELDLELEGWRSSSPVRVGNGAATQTQLDMYGHLLDAVGLWHTRGGEITDDEWCFLESVVNDAVTHRHDDDSGIWEMRGPPRPFVHSKVMIWVALDRGIRLVEEHGLPDGSIDRWRSARDEVRHEVETRGVDPERGNFVQCYGMTAVDASLLKLPLVGFVDPCDERMLRTTDAIVEELAVPPQGFLRRYRSTGSMDAGSGGHAGSADADEGVFLLCSCWLVEVLALQGRRDEARALFESLAALANDVGLLSEEYDPETDELLGNFPQAFTHLGLIAAEQRLRETA